MTPSLVTQPLVAAAAAVLLAAVAHAGTCTPADLDGSGTVDGADLGSLLARWGFSGGLDPADLNSDGEVDSADLGLLLAAWGDTGGACLGIASIAPSSGGADTTVTLTGTFPDANALNYSLLAINAGGTVVPFDVLSVTATTMTAVVGPAPAGMGTGTLVISLGTGNAVEPAILPTELSYLGSAWVWSSDDAGVISSVEFEFTGAPRGNSYFGEINGGELCISVPADCDTGTTFDTWFVARHVSEGPIDPFAAVALRIPPATLLRSQDPLTCADTLSSVIGDVLNAHAPDPIPSTSTTQYGRTTGFILGIALGNVNANSAAFVVRTPEG